MSEEIVQEAETTETPDAPSVDETVAAEPEAPVNPNWKWYVVHTYSGYENRAKKSLEERIKQANLFDAFGEILIPMETVSQVKGGAIRQTKRKFFPGYMIVQMELNDTSWHLVKSTPKVTGFVGNAVKPMPISDKEVARLTQQMTEGVTRAAPTVAYSEGDQVRVIDGPFANFNGNVEEVNGGKQKVKVTVSIFGRSTPVELDFVQVERIS